jgi:hypothetical protein
LERRTNKNKTKQNKKMTTTTEVSPIALLPPSPYASLESHLGGGSRKRARGEEDASVYLSESAGPVFAPVSTGPVIEKQVLDGKKYTRLLPYSSDAEELKKYRTHLESIPAEKFNIFNNAYLSFFGSEIASDNGDGVFPTQWSNVLREVALQKAGAKVRGCLPHYAEKDAGKKRIEFLVAPTIKEISPMEFERFPAEYAALTRRVFVGLVTAANSKSLGGLSEFAFKPKEKTKDGLMDTTTAGADSLAKK